MCSFIRLKLPVPCSLCRCRIRWNDIGDSRYEIAIGSALEFRHFCNKFLVQICKELLVGVDLGLQCGEIGEPKAVAALTLLTCLMETV
jgi:hypothetical protein